MPRHAATKTRSKKPKPATPERSTLPESTEVLLDREEVAAALRISTRRFLTLRAVGKYPAPDIMIGRLPRWTQTTHNRWVESIRNPV